MGFRLHTSVGCCNGCAAVMGDMERIPAVTGIAPGGAGRICLVLPSATLTPSTSTITATPFVRLLQSRDP